MIRTLIFGSLSFAAFAQTSPQEALRELIAGNKRYVTDTSSHPKRGKEQRESVYLKQQPFAVIIGCSDSRAAPELIFDQGVGDLFVIRVAGNVIGPLELDSIDYAVRYLNSSLILVMGHENCGAVDATLKGNTQDIEAVAALIEPAAVEARAKSEHDLLYRTTIDNAERMKNYLLTTPLIQKLAKEGKVQVHSGYYNFLSGKVDLNPH